MTKTAKTVIFLIIMKIKLILPCSQAYGVIILLFFLAACSGKKEETPVIPPLTSPLSGSFVGYGVVNVSYTRVTANPEEKAPEGAVTEGTTPEGPGPEGAAPEGAVSEGTASGSYLRQGSVVRILQRRQVKNQDKLESWVQVDGSGAGGSTSLGWLRESLVDIYDSEAQARTASESMGR
jgi:hypothetical protein